MSHHIQIYRIVLNCFLVPSYLKIMRHYLFLVLVRLSEYFYVLATYYHTSRHARRSGGCPQNMGHVSPRTCSLAISPLTQCVQHRNFFNYRDFFEKVTHNFLSFFLGWRIPNLINELSECCASNETRRTQETVPDQCKLTLRLTTKNSSQCL